MKNDGFEDRMKELENELLAIKTASAYASVRSASFTSSNLVHTGLYRITYGPPIDPIFSIVLCGTSNREWGIGYPRTAGNNTQIVEINSDRYDPYTQTVTTLDVPLVVVSNRPVTKIERI